MQKLISITIISLFLYGCSASRKGNINILEGDLATGITKGIISGNNLTNFNFIIQKAEIELINEETKVSLLASIRYQKEGKYLISAKTRSGIEIVRILITKDTILANDRVNKKFFYGSAKSLESKYGISFGALAILFGDAIVRKEFYSEPVQCKNNEGFFNEANDYGIVKYTISCRDKKVSKAQIEKENSGNNIEITFIDFTKSGSLSYPGTIKLKEPNSKSELKVEIKKIEVSETENIRFIKGTGYEEVMIR